MRPTVDVCRKRSVGTPDVVGGRSFQADERGPFLCQRRRESKLGGLVSPVRSRDGQWIDFGVCGVSGNPERSFGPVDFPQEPRTAGHGLTDVDAGGRPGREGADYRDLVCRRLHDLLPGPFDGDEWPPKIRDGRQLAELAQYMAEDVQAMANRDREYV